jgi:hypothetical protein
MRQTLAAMLAYLELRQQEIGEQEMAHVVDLKVLLVAVGRRFPGRPRQRRGMNNADRKALLKQPAIAVST